MIVHTETPLDYLVRLDFTANLMCSLSYEVFTEILPIDCHYDMKKRNVSLRGGDLPKYVVGAQLIAGQLSSKL